MACKTHYTLATGEVTKASTAYNNTIYIQLTVSFVAVCSMYAKSFAALSFGTCFSIQLKNSFKSIFPSKAVGPKSSPR